MFSSAIVVFREVFEIVLILGIVLAATRSMPHRKKAVALGFSGGIAGSFCIAFFTDKISQLAQGMGQEVFNAGILFTAAFFIGWTVLWMKRHSHQIKSKFMEHGQAVAQGKALYISLSLVIGLAILREGAEIVLFTYGMLAAGLSPLTLGIGALIGLFGGVTVGVSLYMGLIKLSLKYFFRVTTILLIFLVAGMISQGFGFLVAAGYFGSLSNVLWDSSWLVSGRGIIGQSLGSLIGYTARPTEIQFFAYVLTLGTLAVWLKFIEKGINISSLFRKRGAPPASLGVIMLIALTGTGMWSTPAHATKKVYTPYVEQGELEAEWRGGYNFDHREDIDGAWKQKVALGYGVTSHWFTELYAEFEHDGESGADTQFSEVEWENRFQLTEPGQYWLDAGLYGAYAVNTTGGPDKVEAKLLLAKDYKKLTHLANIIAERQIGDDANHTIEWGLAWSTRYRYKSTFEPGFEIYSGFEDIGHDDFNEGDHRAGPVAYGTLGSVKYDAGVLFGLSDSAPDATAKLILEYEWRF